MQNQTTTMKSQIENNTQSKGTAGIVRRSALKLLLTACAVLGTLGIPSMVKAQTVNPGTGELPPMAAEAIQRVGFPKKKTQMTNLTPTFTMKNGQWVTLRAQLYYQERTTGKWKPLGYKRVAVQFRIGSIWMGSAMTDSNGWASVTVQIKDAGKIYAQGKRINWRATFSGDIELYRAYADNRFLIMP
jgi:hypothetical protein